MKTRFQHAVRYRRPPHRESRVRDNHRYLENLTKEEGAAEDRVADKKVKLFAPTEIDHFRQHRLVPREHELRQKKEGMPVRRPVSGVEGGQLVGEWDKCSSKFLNRLAKIFAGEIGDLVSAPYQDLGHFECRMNVTFQIRIDKKDSHRPASQRINFCQWAPYASTKTNEIAQSQVYQSDIVSSLIINRSMGVVKREAIQIGVPTQMRKSAN